MDEIVFSEETCYPEAFEEGENKVWSILVVDDEEDVHIMTQLVLENYSFKGMGVKLFHAYTLKEAKIRFSESNDIALVLLDVVMEDNDSGFRFIEHVRDECNNHLSRIILRTGQPGYAPEREVIINYDINDYVSKSTADTTRFLTATTTALRSYQDIITIEDMRQNLEVKVRERTAQLHEKSLELEKLVVEIEKVAAVDPLTGLYNRREFYFQLQDKINQHKRYKRELSMVMFDVDFFKKINDTHGHDVGDKVLVDLAVLVGSFIRSCDVFARWGGEEFIILLPEANLEEATNAAEKLRKSIEEHPFEGVGKITSSFGATMYQSPEAMDECIKRVDEALYMAKNSGRNNVQVK